MNLMKMLGYAFVMCNQKTGFENFVSGNEVGWGTCHSKAKFAVLAILALFDPGDLMDISWFLFFTIIQGFLAGKDIH